MPSLLLLPFTFIFLFFSYVGYNVLQSLQNKNKNKRALHNNILDKIFVQHFLEEGTRGSFFFSIPLKCDSDPTLNSKNSRRTHACKYFKLSGSSNLSNYGGISNFTRCRWKLEESSINCISLPLI